MSFSIVNSRTLSGISAPQVAVEVHLANGLPSFTIVGLAQTAIKESRDRVRSAIINSNFNFPAKKITVNLAPADLPKEGTRFDLPIAVGILMASEQLPISSETLGRYEFIGELALNGRLRAVQGVLPVAHAVSLEQRKLALPAEAVAEAAFIDNLALTYSSSLTGLIENIIAGRSQAIQRPDRSLPDWPRYPDFAHVKGQQLAKRALEIAATGRHNLLMVGPPGCGKTMLASCLPGIFPPLTRAQAIETASIYSVSRQGFDIKNWRHTPIRNPHHSCSAVALIGGGSKSVPGEVSLAHNGVLFLDELSEFDSRALEMLREPLETGYVNIARIKQSQSYLADILLIAAANPCRCGYLGSQLKQCHCSPAIIDRYRNKLSGPLIDRIDMRIELAALSAQELLSQPVGESSEQIALRVNKFRQLQLTRQGSLNNKLSVNQLEAALADSKKLMVYLHRLAEKLKITARSYHRILRLSRTIADMDTSLSIRQKHINEALLYRMLDA